MRSSLRRNPAIAPLIRERYWGRWPSQAELLARRWEEGWNRPLAKWREQLGIAALVANSPFMAETPRG